MEIRFNIKNSEELEILKEIVEFDFSVNGFTETNKPETLISLLQKAGIDEKDELEIKLKDKIMLIACSIDVKKGFSLMSQIPISGIEIRGRIANIYLNISGTANSGNVDIIAIQAFLTE